MQNKNVSGGPHSIKLKAFHCSSCMGIICLKDNCNQPNASISTTVTYLQHSSNTHRLTSTIISKSKQTLH